MTTKRELKNRLAYKNDRELLLADIAFENVLDWLNGSEATKARGLASQAPSRRAGPKTAKN
jgi:hypothetical protein